MWSKQQTDELREELGNLNDQRRKQPKEKTRRPTHPTLPEPDPERQQRAHKSIRERATEGTRGFISAKLVTPEKGAQQEKKPQPKRSGPRGSQRTDPQNLTDAQKTATSRTNAVGEIRAWDTRGLPAQAERKSQEEGDSTARVRGKII